MEYRVFKSKPEEKLFQLYLALGKYFNDGDPVSFTGYYDKIGNILPYLSQCFTEFWCKGDNDYTKYVKK